MKKNQNLTINILFPLFLVLAEATSYLSTDMYLPALPQIAEALQTSPNMIQMTLTAWFMGSAALQLFLGPLSDYLGRKPILLTGGFVFVISTIVCAITTNIAVLMLARFAQGTTVAFVIVAGYASIHELFDQTKAIKTLAWMSAITILAPALGPVLGGAIVSFTSYHAIFWILAVLGTIFFSILAKFMPETNPDGREKHPLEPKAIAQSYKNLFCNKTFMQYLMIFCFTFGGFIAWLVYSPFLLIDKLGFTPFAYGWSQALIFTGFIIGTRAVKVLIEKVDLQKLIFAGVSLAFIGSMIAFVFSLFTTHWVTLLFPLSVFAMGAGMAFAPLNRATIESSDEGMGKKVAVFSFMMGVFCVLGSILASSLYDGTSIVVTSIIAISSTISFVTNLRRTAKACQK